MSLVSSATNSNIDKTTIAPHKDEQVSSSARPENQLGLIEEPKSDNLNPKSSDEIREDLKEISSLEQEIITSDKDIETVVEESLSEDSEAPPHFISQFLGKFMPVISGCAIAFNGLSAACDTVESKTGNSNPILSKMGETLSELSNKGQALGFGADVLVEAFTRKDATLLVAGFGKLFQVLMANSEDFLQLGGIQTAFDQLKPACEKLIGKSEFKSFGDSFEHYKKALTTIFKEMKEDPMGYLTLNPKSGKVEQVLAPGSALMLAGTVGCMVTKGNKTLRTAASVVRHILGGILGGDVILARIAENKDLSLSGYLYGAASAIDTAVTPLKDKLSTAGHKFANTLYFAAEYLFLKGLKKDPEKK